MTPRVGIVGYGEAGGAFAAGLVRAGVSVVVFDTRLAEPGGEELRRRARAADVALVEDVGALVDGAQVILSLVTSSAALPVARDLARHLTADHLVADLNSTSPGLAREVFRVIATTGAAFADVAVMAAVPPHGHRVPLLACGPGASQLASLDIGLEVDVVDGAPGAASAIKMLRSMLVKGLEALLLEFAVASRRFGATDRVLTSLNGTLPTDDWRELASYLLARTAQHGERRGHELEEVSEMLRELDMEPYMAAAGAQRLLWAAHRGVARKFRERAPGHYEDVLAALEQEAP